MPLTDLACRNTKAGKTLRKLSDGGGLQLWLQPNGSKLWRLAYRFDGKQKLLAIGPYPLISLVEARQARDQAKRALLAGEDPSAQKLAAKAEAEVAITFRTLAEEYVEKLKRERKAERTIAKVEWLLGLAYDDLGSRPAASIKAGDIFPVLQRIELSGRRETAKRLRSTIGAVFRYGIATARAEADPTAALKGALAAPIVTPRAAVTEPKKLGALIRAIDSFDGQVTTRAALKLMVLLFPRPGELRASEWAEFDFAKSEWNIPASRAKMRRPHRVPLPPQAVVVLQDLHCLTGRGKLAFPSVRSVLRPISENTLNAALRRLGYARDEATAHGFRATASTLLNESGLWHPDAIERQLAHVEGNAVRRAYARGEHWDERVRMMGWWANYLDKVRSEI
ncbi:tyrosine-type recombinase/integrase [Ancylobacter sp. Lp-2]|uniref:tyrosine-type recombinase/integrase n=1 Tax=Ancylobacter sp. Lp-2 TaxID=2881339 RepID=UPI001E32F47C|nr:tyrosine-type recombinase/integrase [Ancylobacter sp. Lp-2]